MVIFGIYAPYFYIWEGCMVIYQGVNVAVSAWYAPAVEWVANTGIIKGIDSKLFNPEAEITRKQMEVMLDIYVKYKDFNLPSNQYIAAI
jgi:hypothetical protein